MSNDHPLPNVKEGESNQEAELSQRLDRLGRSLDERRRSEVERGTNQDGDANGIAQALRLSTEFVAGVVVGAALGWALDYGLGTSPWGLIVFLLLGFAAGVFNTLRAAGLMAEASKRAGDGSRKNESERSIDRSDNKTAKG